MPVRPIHNKAGTLTGYQADVADAQRGVPRTKRAFSIAKNGTAKQAKQNAKDWERAVLADAQRRLLGGRKRRLFGETLAEYYAAHKVALTADDAKHKRFLSNLKALRYPVINAENNSYIRLEELPVEKTHPDEIDIVDGLRCYTDDQKQILKRSRINKELYQLRANTKGVQWYWQPAPEQGPTPSIRALVKDPALIETLNATPGLGPMAPDTLRVRQALVSTVLHWAYLERKTSHDQSTLIKRETTNGRREAEIVTYAQLLSLLIHMDSYVDLAILAANFIGWRKANILGLDWPHVVFPVYRDNELMVPGHAWVDAGDNTDPGKRTKKRKKLIHPMTPFTEQIFRLAWEQRKGDLVFHDGHGKKIGDIRKSFYTAKKVAGITGALTPWHGWRHNFNTRLGRARATPHEMMGLAGWSQIAMTEHYMHDQTVAQAHAYSHVLESMINQFKGEK